MKKRVLGREKIKLSIRKKILGTEDRPRLTVFRSNKNIYAQVVLDTKGVTLVSASNKDIKVDKAINKTDAAKEVGLIIAKKAESCGIKKIVFDRNGYLYHGRVKQLAEGARQGGLEF